MKKKILISIIAVILCTAIITCTSVFAGEGFSDLSNPENAENLAVTQLESIESGKGKNAEKATDGNINSVWKSTGINDSLVITFKEEIEFNTVVLRERGWNVKNFNLSYYDSTPGNEHWQMFYQQDAIEDYRYCAFDTVKAKQIKLEVTESDSIFKIREFEIYNIERKELDSFRVSDYVITGTLASGDLFNPESENYFYPEYCDVINQIHVIAAAKWNDAGELVIADNLSGEELKAAVQRMRDWYGERDVEIFATVFFNACNPTTVLTDAKDDVIENTVQFLLDYGFDGVSYDWEYPTKAQWPLFDDHIVRLKNELEKHNLKLSCAVCPWNFYMGDEAIKALDQIEIMAYDLFDANGNHSSFSSGAVQPVEYFLDKGFAPEQINLGLPLYARPYDGGGIWVDFDDPNYTPSNKFQNFSNGMWFSGTQMTMDKTAYALDKNLGGLMLFTSTADVPYENDLSIIKSIRNTIDTRTVANDIEKEAE